VTKQRHKKLRIVDFITESNQPKAGHGSFKNGFVNVAHRQLVCALYCINRNYQTRILTGTLRVSLEGSA
jgi:hypothetical protein